MRDAGQVTRYMYPAFRAFNYRPWPCFLPTGRRPQLYPAAASQQRTDVLWWNTRLRLALEQKC